jgi:3-hydroxyisobutyrate dehydrogenase-like beta-hydroxyacid dehydrogenase
MVIGFDSDTPRGKQLASAGVRLAKSTAEVAEQADLIFSSLPSQEALEGTVAAIVGARRRLGQVLVELSTLSLACKIGEAERLAAAGVAMLDTPISGTGAQAAKGDIALYVSGKQAICERCRPVFADFSREVFYLGELGNGTRMKLVANLLVAIHNVAAAEALSLGLRCGLDPSTLCRVLAAGAGQSRMLEVRGPMMVEGVYEPPTMKLEVWQKDMRLIADFANAVGAATPLFDATVPLYRAATGDHPRNDTAAVRLAVEALADRRPR